MSKFESVATIDWYNQNASEYARAVGKIISIDQIVAFTNILPKNAKILDAGCGGGRDAEIFFKQGYQVVGSDLSMGMLIEAKKQNNFQGFVNANHLSISLQSNSLNGVWAHGSLHHMESHESFKQAIIEFCRVLKSGGILHLATQAQTSEFESKVVLDTLTNCERFYIYFTQDRLENLLKATGFEILNIEQFKETDKKVNAGRKDVEWLVALAKKV